MGKFSTGLRRSSPTILTVLGIVGVVGTAVTAVLATPKALAIIDYEKRNRSKEHYDAELDEWIGDALTKKEIVELTWRCYIPAALMGLSTITCIIGIHVMNRRNQASLASAYAMLSESYNRRIWTRRARRFSAMICFPKDISLRRWLP